MKTIQVNENNDFTVDASGNFTILVDADAVPQEARHHAATRRGEMIHATAQGVPYFEFAFGASPRLGQLEAALRRRLLETEGVLEIESLVLQQNGDVLDYVAVLRTEYGSVPTNGRL